VPKKDDKVSKSTLLLSVALVAVVAFVAGTRSDQLYAAIAPVFGIKASADTLDTAVLQQAFRELKANYDGSLDAGKLTDGAARGMVAAAGDRYTVFMDKEEAEQFNKDLRGEISGIGCEIGVRGDQATVLRVLADSPAQAAGVKVGDIFVSVNGESVEGLDASTVAGKVRGEKGTTVKLVMQRGEEQKEFTITRAEVTDASVRWSIDNGIGTMTMSRFDDDTGRLATQAAKEFKAQGVKGVVLDLRGNGGGYLSAAVDVAGIWLDNKVVVTEKANGKVTGTEKTGSGALLAGVKTVVLVNGASASASEIVAGALQDHKAATIVGEKTFGKGTVQKVVNLLDGRLLKVTIARWYTPNGKNITKEGISPDTKVELTSEDANAGRDPQLEAAINQLRS
jgi:carboxyl-terminal processing protease